MCAYSNKHFPGGRGGIKELLLMLNNAEIVVCGGHSPEFNLDVSVGMHSFKVFSPPLPPSLPPPDVKEAQLRGSQPQDEGTVVPLIMQNKPPTVEGREEDELADVELRPEQVCVCLCLSVWRGGS